MPRTLNDANKLKLINTGLELLERPGTKKDATFMARELIQCTLPHSDPGDDLPAWVRINGSRALIIQPGWNPETGTSFGYPFGTLPRLVLYWIVTEAKRTGSRKLELGDGKGSNSLAAWMRQLGLDPSRGGKRSDAKRLQDAMYRLFNARISFQETGLRAGDQKRDRRRNMEVAGDYDLWWNSKSHEQSTLFPSWVELGEKFFEAITAYTVPCDIRALKALKNSPLALDLYALLNYLGATMQKPEHFISWGLLHQQLGANYDDLGNFRKHVRRTLVKVRTVHPGLDAMIPKAGGGILVKPSLPAIPRLG